MLQGYPRFAELSRLFERQLVAERGLEIIIKYGNNASPISATDRKALIALCQLFDELLEGEQILTGHDVTNTMIDASIALQEVISLTLDHRSVSEFVEGLKMMKKTVNTMLDGRKPSLIERRTLEAFLTSLAETVGQELDESTTSRTVVPY
jgi:hypothetical protein